MRRRSSGGFELPIDASAAIEYFTPEGERLWAPGWSPHYPAGEVDESPGCVFITSHGGDETVWTIHAIDRERCTAAYTRHRVGEWAGTVAVRCEDIGPQRCRVTVDYDTTVLPGGDPSILDEFEAAPYEHMMSHWSDAVRHAL